MTIARQHARYTMGVPTAAVKMAGHNAICIATAQRHGEPACTWAYTDRVRHAARTGNGSRPLQWALLLTAMRYSLTTLQCPVRLWDVPGLACTIQATATRYTCWGLARKMFDCGDT
jgi:hypothetical protein